MAQVADPDEIRSKREAISAIVPFAMSLERDGQPEMFDVILYTVKASKCWTQVWDRIEPYVVTELGKSPSLNRFIALASRHFTTSTLSDQLTVSRWAEAVLKVPYMDEVGQSVVDAAMQIAYSDSLRPQIPTEIWMVLKKRPCLPPVCFGRSLGTTSNVVRHIRRLEDPEILKSYLFVVWSEWDPLQPSGPGEMKISFREDFGGIGMWGHREDLAKRLNCVLEQLDRGFEWLKTHNRFLHEYEFEQSKEQYEELRDALLDIDRDATNILIREPLTTIVFCDMLIPADHGV